MDYQFREIEQKWQKFWADKQTFKVENSSDKPKYYVLDMFPYPSGAGLHVGHPLGYIASDIFARYKRLKGFNVLHPMGYDSFGLPAEQYAIQTGQHPAITTETNIATYRRQLDQLGFSFDWSRELRTSDASYYKWTQWIFMQLFNSWYNLENDRAEDITTLIEKFNSAGTADVKAVADDDTRTFLPSDWATFTEEEKQVELLKYRLTYLRESTVNWCAALGTVLANDEVKDGFSERGGHPVEQKKMMQWSMRITAYADRLLQGLDTIDWPEPVKEMQRNWIGKSVGASVKFKVESLKSKDGTLNFEPLTFNFIEVFTTRVDTIFGVSYLVLAPEHEWVTSLTTPEQEVSVKKYITDTKKKSELDRMADTKTVSGAFTGSYAINPVNDELVPIWIADYVLAGYGTGAVMGVPSGDQRDWLFAKHFNLPLPQILDGQKDLDVQADPTKEGKYINSGFINGMTYAEAIPFINNWLEENEAGKAKINYRQRDAIFGRQRYWGEPIPVYFKNGLPYLVKEEEFPLVLPEIDKYLPTETGEPPLARAEGWKYGEDLGGANYELSTMPGWAGSSWYWYRYMDANNNGAFADKKAIDYWQDVDLYIGGMEHATGHLLYSRFWNKFLKDLGYVNQEEPFKKLINQGMIQGMSEKIYRRTFADTPTIQSGDSNRYFVKTSKAPFYDSYRNKMPIAYYSAEVADTDACVLINVPINLVKNSKLNIEEYIQFLGLQNRDSVFYTDRYVFKYLDGVGTWHEITGGSTTSTAEITPLVERPDYIFKTKQEVEKMSKSKWNVVNPDDLIERYGADTLRMYEMFLGPLEQSKPWNTNGIEGVFKFLRKFWKLFHNNENWDFNVSDAEPTKAELKALHKIIKKVQEDIERFSFNTSVSSFMIAVNELMDLKCNNRAILQDMVVVLSPYAPHICEELWTLLGNEKGTLSFVAYPTFNPTFLVEDEFAYPVSINGKMKMNLQLSLTLTQSESEEILLADEQFKKYLDGKAIKKIIFVKGKIINVVV